MTNLQRRQLGVLVVTAMKLKGLTDFKLVAVKWKVSDVETGKARVVLRIQISKHLKRRVKEKKSFGVGSGRGY